MVQASRLRKIGFMDQFIRKHFCLMLAGSLWVKQDMKVDVTFIINRQRLVQDPLFSKAENCGI